VSAVYAIFEDGGKQYKVAPGDKVYVERRDLGEGQQTIEFDRVLAVGEGADARIGRPVVEGAKVVARVAGEVKAAKVRTVKLRRRKNSVRTIGHRQRHLEVTISEIVG
jgi:large subunit ribosomal protein L21